MRQEHIMKQKKMRTVKMSARRNKSSRALSSERHEHHPMGKLNVSSVKAPSDIQSLMASPPMNDRKILDSRVFGSGKGSKI